MCFACQHSEEALFYSWIIFYVIPHSRIRHFFFRHGILGLWRPLVESRSITCHVNVLLMQMPWKLNCYFGPERSPIIHWAVQFRCQITLSEDDAEGCPLKAPCSKQFPFCSSYRRFAGSSEFPWQVSEGDKTPRGLVQKHGCHPLICRIERGGAHWYAEESQEFFKSFFKQNLCENTQAHVSRRRCLIKYDKSKQVLPLKFVSPKWVLCFRFLTGEH